MATSKGFVVVESDENAGFGGGLVNRKASGDGIRGKSPIYGQPILRGRSDYCMVMLKDPSDGNVRSLMLFNLVTGAVKTIIRTVDPISQAALLFNLSGSRIVYGLVPSAVSRPSGILLSVREVGSNRTLDQFRLPNRASLADYSESGKMVLYRDAEHATLCRDVDLHKTVFERSWDGAELPVAASVSSNDSAMAEYYPDGRADTC